jgi:hypothetical protein
MISASSATACFTFMDNLKACVCSFQNIQA